MICPQGCNDEKPTEPEGYNVDRQGIPHFVRAHHIEVGKIDRVSKFRSACGTDYSDDIEHCRSMKHAFEPRSEFDWSTLAIYSPVDGTVIRKIQETSGVQIQIKSDEYPDIEFHIFHVAPMITVDSGRTVKAGEQIGTHVGRPDLPEIAVGIHTTQGWKLVSFFDVIVDSLTAPYDRCFAHSRNHFIINKEERDRDPLACDGNGAFIGRGTLDDWMDLDCSYDVEAWGIPKFIDVNYMEFERIYRISRFRSSVGHVYIDDFEQCSSMKHYFQPDGEEEWETVRIYAPVTGTVSWILEEWLGTQVWIRSQQYPDFEFGIFHINLQDSLVLGQAITAGQLLGTHISTRTYSDIAVSVRTPGGRKLISYFETMTDALFQQYQARGLNQRADAIIAREERDANPICHDGIFDSDNDPIEKWVYLRPE